jgi:hypothetical protein
LAKAVLTTTAVHSKGEKRSSETETPRAANAGAWWTWAAASAVLLVRSIEDMLALNTAGPKRLQVFGTFWASGWAANHGLNPYAIYPLTWVFDLPRGLGKMLDLNLNPPAMLPAFQATALLAPNTAVKVWTLLSVAILIGCAAWLIVEYRQPMQRRQVVWLLWCAASFDTLKIGQNYAWFALLAVAAWSLLERHREVAAGLCLGALIAAKPNFAVWALFLAFAHRRKAAAVAVVAGVIVFWAPLALYGAGVYGAWLHAMQGDRHWIYTTDVSLVGFAARAGHRRVGEALALLLLAGSSLLVLWKRPSLRDTSGLAVCVAILAAPLAWFHYTLLLAGPLMSRRWGWALTAILFPLMLPIRVLYLPSLCLLTGYFVCSTWREPRPEAGLAAGYAAAAAGRA